MFLTDTKRREMFLRTARYSGRNFSSHGVYGTSYALPAFYDGDA